MLEVREETTTDYAETADLAAAAFDLPLASFAPARLEWLYTRAFGDGATILGLFEGSRKVGQVVLVHQRVRIDGEPAAAVALFDLFISKAFRSREAIGALYGAVERLCTERGVRFIIGVPNESGSRVNIRYLKLAPVRRLEVRAGLAVPRRSRRVTLSRSVASLTRENGVDLLGRYMPCTGVGLDWTAETLWGRLTGGFSPFAVHATTDLLLVSSVRRTRGLTHTLLCGFFATDRTAIDRRAVTALTSAACRFHRRPVYVYAGCHDGVPLPGLTLPDAMRPSPLAVQMRDFEQPDRSLTLNRFELLDFDFA